MRDIYSFFKLTDYDVVRYFVVFQKSHNFFSLRSTKKSITKFFGNLIIGMKANIKISFLIYNFALILKKRLIYSICKIFCI
jgi:hypothetical protein